MFDELVRKMTNPSYNIKDEFDVEALMIAGLVEPLPEINGVVSGYKWSPDAFLFVAHLCRLSDC